jgi:hypothetical protein
VQAVTKVPWAFFEHDAGPMANVVLKAMLAHKGLDQVSIAGDGARVKRQG